ncbi:uncharacterized protein LOC101852036 [Aplysia californica]|uniref:Uncharacterized protein LOC101852036 n=1 Tax=Aplysia californica TaxID=6500 RepID=A0ABM1A521_APLCA|nr:uncharacterized protein LOC101852036 [Aplysia californica]
MGQASTMFMGGILERRLGPRITCLLGGWFMSLGVVLTYFSVQHSFALTVLTYGVMFGVGIGFGYAIPLGCAMKWFPNRKGLANGVVVAGFGGGAFIFNQVQTAFINPDNLKLGRGSPGETDEEGYFHDPEMLQRVPHVFLLLGGCYAGMQLFGSLLLCHPSEEYVKDSPSTMAEEMERVELIHSQRGNGAAPLMDCMSISPR